MNVRVGNKKLNMYRMPMILAGILFVGVLISTVVVINLYAKYVAIDHGEDAARVAAFGSLTLTEEIDGKVMGRPTETMPIIPGDDISKRVYVDFSGSEMDTYVFVAVKPSDGWNVTSKGEIDNMVYSYGNVINEENNNETEPILRWEIESTWESLGESVVNGETEYVYYTYLESNEPLFKRDIIKKIEGSKDKYISVSEWVTESDLSEITDENKPGLSFRAVVVQAGGFADKETAWNAVK